jgi:hypothetical protein
MTTQHTPGPWEVGYCTWNDDGNVCYELKGIKRASALDARLIAAAPDLLEALEFIAKQSMSMYGSYAYMIEKLQDTARNAISKATGQE